MTMYGDRMQTVRLLSQAEAVGRLEAAAPRWHRVARATVTRDLTGEGDSALLGSHGREACAGVMRDKAQHCLSMRVTPAML
jgi:hypothetical protein